MRRTFAMFLRFLELSVEPPYTAFIQGDDLSTIRPFCTDPIDYGTDDVEIIRSYQWRKLIFSKCLDVEDEERVPRRTPTESQTRKKSNKQISQLKIEDRKGGQTVQEKFDDTQGDKGTDDQSLKQNEEQTGMVEDTSRNVQRPHITKEETWQQSEDRTVQVDNSTVQEYDSKDDQSIMIEVDETWYFEEGALSLRPILDPHMLDIQEPIGDQTDEIKNLKPTLVQCGSIFCLYDDISQCAQSCIEECSDPLAKDTSIGEEQNDLVDESQSNANVTPEIAISKASEEDGPKLQYGWNLYHIISSYSPEDYLLTMINKNPIQDICLFWRYINNLPALPNGNSWALWKSDGTPDWNTPENVDGGRIRIFYRCDSEGKPTHWTYYMIWLLANYEDHIIQHFSGVLIKRNSTRKYTAEFWFRTPFERRHLPEFIRILDDIHEKYELGKYRWKFEYFKK